LKISNCKFLEIIYMHYTSQNTIEKTMVFMVEQY